VSDLRLDRLATLDFEASCYPDAGKSFPVEVAVCRVASGETRSWLIRPHEKWAGWTWDPQAEAVHHLTRERLAREGRPAGEVLRELAEAVAGLTVVCDSHSDEYWLSVLADAAGAAVPFELGSVTRLLRELASVDRDRYKDWCKSVEAQALERWPEQHRAAPDAQRLAEMIRIMAEPRA
jgi:DNA polymerase III epsilon subunit-like protein